LVACRHKVASGADPGQPDVRGVNTPTLKNAPRPILRQFKNGPISMELDQAAAIDGPKQTGSARTVERTMTAAAEQGQGIPT
jgi:hypothetical protein